MLKKTLPHEIKFSHNKNAALILKKEETVTKDGWCNLLFAICREPLNPPQATSRADFISRRISFLI